MDKVKLIALWDTVILAVYLGCTLHILANVDHTKLYLIYKIVICRDGKRSMLF